MFTTLTGDTPKLGTAQGVVGFAGEHAGCPRFSPGFPGFPDARLVALMKTYSIARIATFNVKDFARFIQIEAVHPDRIA